MENNTRKLLEKGTRIQWKFKIWIFYTGMWQKGILVSTKYYITLVKGLLASFNLIVGVYWFQKALKDLKWKWYIFCIIFFLQVKLKCNIAGCGNNKGKGISAQKKSACNVLKHVERCHFGKSAEVKAHVNRNKQSPSCPSNQPTSTSKQGSMDSFLRPPQPKVGSKPTQSSKADVEIITSFLIEDIMPLSLVQKPGFLKMMDIYRPDVKIPTRKTIVKSIQVCNRYGWNLGLL